MNTGALIKELRKQKRISAETIAEKLNVHPSTVYRWEKGDIEKIPYQTLIPLARILNVSPLDLLGVDDNVDKEQRLIRSFNLLTEEQQDAVLLTIESMIR